MKKPHRIWLFLLLVALLCLGQPLTAQAAEIAVYIDGSRLQLDTSPWLNEENGRIYVPLRTVAEGMGYECLWDGGKSALLKNATQSAFITQGECRYTVNGSDFYADAYPMIYQNRIMAPLRAVAEALRAAVDFDAARNSIYISTDGIHREPAAPIIPGEPLTPGSPAGRTVILDAGHGSVQPGGWTDPGAMGYNGLAERDVVLDVVFRTAELLRQNGVTVILTRTEEHTYLTLAQRAAFASQYDADAFVSVHCNANANRSYNGTGMYMRSDSSHRAADTALATALQKSTVNALATKDNGLFWDDYAVVKNLPCAGVIAEIAFISNLREEKLLGTAAFRAKAAQGLAAGILSYLNSL